MDEQLVGYLLNALDPEAQREIETHLRTSPESRRRLELLRRVLEPLAADAEAPVPPSGLWIRTLARVAENQCRRLPPVPKRTAATTAVPRMRWRRADLLVAASLLLVAGLVGLGGLGRLHQAQQMTSCKNNLRHMYESLTAYAAQNNGAFPRVEERRPMNVAGIFIPVLNDAGVLNPLASTTCPGNGRLATQTPTIAELRALSPQQFQERVRGLAGCYAYTLGYVDRDAFGRVIHLYGLRQDSGDDLPILADCPALTREATDVSEGNSGNHGRRGQNVLHVGGNVRFLTGRTIGPNQTDDIYRNRHNRLAAGEGPRDTVLGPSWATSLPD